MVWFSDLVNMVWFSDLVNMVWFSDLVNMVWFSHHVFPLAGSDAEQKGLKSGDEVLQIQDSPLQGLTRFEAWTLIKGLDDGPFTLGIKRNKCD